jgi:hypothetical protein
MQHLEQLRSHPRRIIYFRYYDVAFDIGIAQGIVQGEQRERVITHALLEVTSPEAALTGMK